MSSGTNAFGARAGFNQAGGAYFVTLAALDGTDGAIGNYINTITAVGSNSGGAYAQPTLALTAMSTVLTRAQATAGATNASTIVGSGKLLKDMGRTVVSAGRTFRKFAPVVAGVPSTFGTFGSAGTTTNAGYGAFYLEVGREGVGSSNVAPIARYF